MDAANGSNSAAPAEHFSYGQLGAVFMCALVLGFVSLMKNGFELPWKQEAQAVKTLTYEEARGQVLAKYGMPEENSNQYAEAEIKKSSDQLAMIDPSLVAGAVLGESTGTIESMLDIPPAEQIFTEDILKQIPVNTIADGGPELVQNYADNLLEIESQYDTVGMLQVLAGGESQGALKQVSEDSLYLIANLSLMEVPKDLETYHKFKILFYGALGTAANFYDDAESTPGMDQISSELFSIKSKLDALREEVLKKYNVEL